jgi:hypothetical protein
MIQYTLTIRGWFLATFLIGLMLLVTSHLDDYQAWAVRHRLNHSRWWCPICLSANPTDYVPECEHDHGANVIVELAQLAPADEQRPAHIARQKRPARQRESTPRPPTCAMGIASWRPPAE